MSFGPLPLPSENAMRPVGAFVAPAAGSAAMAVRANPRTVRRRVNLLIDLYPPLHREPGRGSSARVGAAGARGEGAQRVAPEPSASFATEQAAEKRRVRRSRRRPEPGLWDKGARAGEHLRSRRGEVNPCRGAR